MSKGSLILIFVIVLSFTVKGQTKKVKVHALTFAQLQDSMRTNPKPVLVNFFTDWCVYCRLQDKQIAKSDTLKKVLDRDFYYVAMNAESKAAIKFNGREYQGRSNGLSEGAHELAEVLGKSDGQLAYPVLVVLDDTYKLIYRSQGFMNDTKLLKVLLSVIAMKKPLGTFLP